MRTTPLSATIIMALAGAAAPLQAATIDFCIKGQCEKNAALNRAACSELPPNPSCLPLAKEKLRQCLAYCKDRPLLKPAPRPQPIPPSSGKV